MIAKNVMRKTGVNKNQIKYTADENPWKLLTNIKFGCINTLVLHKGN